MKLMYLIAHHTPCYSSIKKYTNTNLYIDSKHLPDLSNDEVYWHDLIGMLVIDQNFNEILGIVDGLNNYGSDD